MRRQLLIIVVCILAKTTISLAQEKEEMLNEVVISATKFDLKREKTAKVITKITQEDIEKNAGKSVMELLNTVVGVEIRGANTNTTEPKGVFIRGGRTRQLVVLIDGVPVSDPSGINQEFDFRFLSLSQIDYIEILKGPSSTMYGSGASTGVINIVLKKGSNNPIKGVYEAHTGSNNTTSTSTGMLSDLSQNATVNGTIKGINYLASYNLLSTSGMSATKSTTNTAFEDDIYFGENGLLKLGYNFSKKFSIETFFNYDKFVYDFDAGLFTDDKINKGNQHQKRISVKPEFRYNKGKVYALVSYNDLEREVRQFNTFNNSTDTSLFKGKSFIIDLVNRYQFDNQFQVVAGLNYQKHTTSSTTPFENIDEDVSNYYMIDPYLSILYTSDFGLNVGLGWRSNNHSEYGSGLVHEANVSVDLLKIENKVDVRLITTYGTAFIAPSAYQLFSVYGNKDLKPETNRTYEFGFDAKYKDLGTLDVVYFNRKEVDAIIFQNLPRAPFGTYTNFIDSREANGIETKLALQPLQKMKLNLGYTYTNKNEDTDYIPANKIVVNVEGNPLENTFVSLVYRNVGDRTARYFDAASSSTVVTTLDSYNLVDLNANYTLLNGKVTFFGSVSNVLNEDYDDILGYSTRGRNYKLGLRLSFK